MKFPRPAPCSILIVGAGYVGSKLSAFLKEKGHQVVLSDIDDQGDAGIVRVDATREEEVKRLAEHFADSPPDAVVLCTSTKGGGEDVCRALYLDGTGHVCRYFAKSRVVLCSSTALYGVEDGRWVTETHTLAPHSPSTELLAKAEQIVKTAGGVVARISAIYGPNRCVLLERLLTDHQSITGNAERWLNYIHRDDAVSALALLAVSENLSNRVYNISDTCPMQMKDIYSHLCDLLGLPMPEFHAASSGTRRGATNQRISSSLLLSCGWLPLYPCFMDGVYNVLEEKGTTY